MVWYGGSLATSGIMEKNQEFFLKEVRAQKYATEKEIGPDAVKKEISISGQKLLLAIKKIS